MMMMDIGVAPEDVTRYGFIPRYEFTPRTRSGDNEDACYIRYNRDFEHETRVAVPSESLKFVTEFKLLRDDDGFVEWVCIPPGVCVACTNQLCWFHEPGASKTYNELMYELGDAMDKGTCSMEDFYSRLETFYRVKEEAIVGGRAIPHGGYPHKFLDSFRKLRNTFTFVHRILVRSPKGLIRHLVENDLVPSKKDLEQHADEIILTACRNPDPNASVLQYLVENAKLVEFVPDDNNLIGFARTEQTIRFLLRQGLNCKGIKLQPIGSYGDGGKETEVTSYGHVELQFVQYPKPPSQKARILQALFEYGTDYPLRSWKFIDLDSFQVIEKFRSREEIFQWIAQSRHEICMDRNFHLQVWPYLCKNYGFHFTEEEFICALLVNNGPGDWEETDFTGADFVLTYKWIRDKFHLQMVHIDWFFQRFATLINYNNNNRTVVPFPIANNLSILDKYLVWNTYNSRYFSYALKLRLYTLLCIFRRHSGSTLALKPLLHLIVPGIVSDEPYEKELNREEDSICRLQ